MRFQTTRRAFDGTLLLLVGLLLSVTSTAATAQTSQATQSTNLGATCDFGQPGYGARCEHDNGTKGYLGSSDYGAYGERSLNDTFGYLGGFAYGAYGENSLNGTYGYLGGSSFGALARNGNGNFGYFGSGSYGTYGKYPVNGNSGHFGYLGSEDYGAYGAHYNGLGNSDHWGALGGLTYGARGQNANNNRGYLGLNDFGVWGTGTPWAGYFQGDVHITGTLTGGTAAFKVDHPLDPEGKYLIHSTVESPDMMNVYNGNAVTDATGFAPVTLPDYFETLNRDFRYQLTVIGQFSQAIVAQEIQGNRFVIRTDEPNVKVSWQVTGIRQDAWAEANRIVVEEAKPAVEQGYYLHPALYGQPAERSVEWARDPEGMRALKERPARIEQERRRMEQERRQIEQEHQRLGETHQF